MTGSYLSKAFLYLLKLLDVFLGGKFVRLSHIAFIIIAPAMKYCYKALAIDSNFIMIIIIENIFN